MSANDTTSRYRILGVYLLYVAGLVALMGGGLGLLAYALHPMSHAGAGPSDAAEPVRELWRSFVFCGAIVGAGILIGVVGIRLIAKQPSESPTSDTKQVRDRGITKR